MIEKREVIISFQKSFQCIYSYAEDTEKVYDVGLTIHPSMLFV